MSKGEVYYRPSVHSDNWMDSIIPHQRVKVDTSLFSSPSVYHEATGWTDGVATTEIQDHGANTSGTAGTSTVAGSSFTLPTATAANKTRQRSAALTITSGNYFVVYSSVGGEGGVASNFIVVNFQ
ncbi:MAG: hypothetical protein A3K03_10880 [Bdellovibrionales bacterium RIFOXYD1_FULL_44_7]|nr:MAG: hypothetical protein A3K03_10880 [Bdellovibrionales bacterium RIFOXYD1_FULL_44_7]